MEAESSKRLKGTIRALFLKMRRARSVGTGQLEEPAVDTSPACPFGIVVEQRLKDLERNIAEVKGRINGLIFLVIGALLVEAITRLVG